MNNKNNRINILNFLIFLLMVSIYMGRMHLKFVFSIKPFMILTIIILLLFWDEIKFTKLHNYEIALIIFMTFYSLTALNFNYPLRHLRFLLANVVIISFYFIVRGLILKLSLDDFEDYYYLAGLISILLSLFYYLFGMIELNWNTFGNNILVKGVLLDRSFPRLVGVVSLDPNIFVFFISGFFWFCLARFSDSVKYRLGSYLSFLSIILSLSRGAILATVLTLIYYLLKEFNKSIRFKSILSVLFFGVLIFMIAQAFEFQIFERVIERFLYSLEDGGSGRNQLWKNAIVTFKNNPLFGIGLNATVDYGKIHYNDAHYVHNTFLEVLSETGIFGFIIYLIFWIILLYATRLSMKKNTKSKFVYYTLISMFLQIFFLSVLHSEAFYFMLITHYYYASILER